jgi:hypothetical protein
MSHGTRAILFHVARSAKMDKSKLVTPVVLILAAWLIAGPPPPWVTITLSAILALIAGAMLLELLRTRR